MVGGCLWCDLYEYDGEQARSKNGLDVSGDLNEYDGEQARSKNSLDVSGDVGEWYKALGIGGGVKGDLEGGLATDRWDLPRFFSQTPGSGVCGGGGSWLKVGFGTGLGNCCCLCLRDDGELILASSSSLKSPQELSDKWSLLLSLGDWKNLSSSGDLGVGFRRLGDWRDAPLAGDVTGEGSGSSIDRPLRKLKKRFFLGLTGFDWLSIEEAGDCAGAGELGRLFLLLPFFDDLCDLPSPIWLCETMTG